MNKDWNRNNGSCLEQSSVRFFGVLLIYVVDTGDGKSTAMEQEEFQECETGGFYGLAKDLLKSLNLN